MRALVIGCGRMGETISWDLLRSRKVERLTVCDADRGRAKALAERLGGSAPVEWDRLDVTDRLTTAMRLADADVAVSAVPYDHNVMLTELAIGTGTHFCDLGGNDAVVRRQFALSSSAAKAGVRIMPACGIAPGAISVLVRHGIDLLGGPASGMRVRARVGGLPQHPEGVLGYARSFSVRGLVNEYIEPSVIIDRGLRRRVASLTGRESVDFPPPFGTLEAVFTSGGAGTLVDTFEGAVEYLDYKTLRYPGHWERVSTLAELGFFSTECAYQTGSGEMVTPREMTEWLLERNLPGTDEDAIVLEVTVDRADGETVRLRMIDLSDPCTGHTAMQRTTGYSASVIALMLGDGRIPRYGTLRHETDVPSAEFMAEWRSRGLVVRVTRTGR